MQVGRSNIGPATLRWWRSLEITSGEAPAAISASATAKEKPPQPCPTSRSTPRSASPLRARRSSPSGPTSAMHWPVAQWVTTSPGRSRSSTSSIAGGPAPMWTITGSPTSPAAARARSRASRPVPAVELRSMRHLIPTTRSRWAAAASAQAETSSRSGSPHSPVSSRRPIRLMLRRARTRSGAGRTSRRRSPGRVSAPVDPASTQVVTPQRQAKGAGSTPQKVSPATTWVCRSTSPGSTKAPRASSSSRAAPLGSSGSTAATFPARTPRSYRPARPLAGSRSSPPRITRSKASGRGPASVNGSRSR